MSRHTSISGSDREEDDDDSLYDDFCEILEDAVGSPFDTENDIGSFEEKYFGKFDRKIPTHGTLLHLVADRRRPPPPKFISWLLQKFPKLIKAKDSEKKTPLHIALRRRGNAEFVELALENSPDSILAEALEECDFTESNCLHHAIAMEFRSTLRLIEKCSEATFIKGNRHGNTPLHIAVSLDFGLRTRMRPLAKNASSTSSDSISQINPAAALRVIAKDSRNVFYLPEIVQSLLSHNEKSMSVRNFQNQTPYQCRLQLLEERWAGGIIKDDPIAQGMKYFCLRNAGRENAIDILYEKGKGKHIEFDLSSMPSASVSKANLQRLGKHLQFEDTLQYVALPKLKVEDPIKESDFVSDGFKGKNSSKLLTGPTLPDRIGLIDAAIIFKWLSENNVRKIIKVIVIDDGDVPHSDQAIEESLKGFEIEIWDWKKPDICSETIFRAAKDVRIIYLYATGNNAVLRSWSCEKGLVKLRKLEQVNLIVRRGFETEHRRDEELAEFEMDFKENWNKLYGEREPPRLDVNKDDEQKSYGSGFKIQKQQWLTHIDTFAGYIANVEADLENVKVAVIDDGIDGFQGDLTDNIASGVSFCRSPDSDNIMRPYYIPSGGHGTMIARLICRVCPKVRLYVARIEEYRTSDGERFITANSAAEAIRWAVASHVHIICMSWSIEGSSDRNDIMALGKAIEDAYRSNIIILCAFSDDVKNASNSFPAAWTGTWTIGAATAMGDPCAWVDKTQVDFLFPGEHIAIDAVERKSEKTCKTQSGSSIATALAAGTAALLLYIAQLVELDIYEELKSPERMKVAFRNLCTGKNKKYFQAQEHFNLKFGDPAWNWNTGEGKAQMALLVYQLRQVSDLLIN